MQDLKDARFTTEVRKDWGNGQLRTNLHPPSHAGVPSRGARTYWVVYMEIEGKRTVVGEIFNESIFEFFTEMVRLQESMLRDGLCPDPVTLSGQLRKHVGQ